MPKPTPATYTTLRKNIAQLLSEGRERAEQAVERERVRTYSEIGKLIHEHLLSAQTRLRRFTLTTRSLASTTHSPVIVSRSPKIARLTHSTS